MTGNREELTQYYRCNSMRSGFTRRIQESYFTLQKGRLLCSIAQRTLAFGEGNIEAILEVSREGLESSDLRPGLAAANLGALATFALAFPSSTFTRSAAACTYVYWLKSLLSKRGSNPKPHMQDKETSERP